MILTNYHTHTHFCDGTDAPEVYVQKALELGLQVYGFSSHSPLPFDNEWSMKYDGAREYAGIVRTLKDQYSDRLDVYLGMEVDYVPGITGVDDPRIQEFELDYSVGSVHYVDRIPGGRRWEIDYTTKSFEEGLQAIFKGDIMAMVARYYELIRQMLSETSPDILGHLDKIKMHNSKKLFFREDEDWYREEVIKTLDVLAATNVILEVNTRGLYKKRTIEPYPSKWILEEAFKRNIPVMVNGDSHHPREILLGYDVAYALLHEVGYKTTKVLYRNEWIDNPITLPITPTHD